MRKIIQISDEIFWGFNTIVDLDNYNSFDDLARLLKEQLISFLKSHNLLNQVDLAKKLNLHHHNYKSYQDLYESGDDIIYFCGGCCR